jgi:hypothetical protein
VTDKAILAQALKLPKNRRIQLAQRLFQSALDDEALIAGAKLADKRWHDFKRGKTGAKPAREAVEALVRRKRKQ